MSADTRTSVSILIRQLAEETTADGLLEICAAFGTVTDVFIPDTNRPPKGAKAVRCSKGSHPSRFAFVKFASLEEATLAVETLNDADIDGHTILASLARTRPTPSPNTKAKDQEGNAVPVDAAGVSTERRDDTTGEAPDPSMAKGSKEESGPPKAAEKLSFTTNSVTSPPPGSTPGQEKKKQQKVPAKNKGALPQSASAQVNVPSLPSSSSPSSSPQQTPECASAERFIAGLESVSDPADPRLVFFRMKGVRDASIWSAEKAKAVDAGRNLVGALSERVMKRALSGRHKVVTGAISPELVKRHGSLLSDVPFESPPLIVPRETLEEVVGVPLNCDQAVGLLVDLAIPLRKFREGPKKQIRQEVCRLTDVLEPPVLILDDVRSSENLGAIFRTAFSFGVSSALLTGVSAGGCGARACRVSMGALFHFRLVETDDMAQAIEELKADGLTVYGTSPTGDTFLEEEEKEEEGRPEEEKGGTNEEQAGSALEEDILERDADAMWALLVGNEDVGAAEASLAACSRRVKIPQVAGDSLAVSHATSVCLYALGRRLMMKRLEKTPFVPDVA
uniref:RRM domain-containing protein n=1 Tax=Chromera velia CCMP2878 TaxID=1169474 RepID=A0A0G4H171_9ALVE|eukprot:Cvel_813.t1-p1 / transcript=Cvel_813.t1 / gene=Cvel_813 / organism=Chromera_velia_CCMP2878 / gene_product=23S rRNA (guanosine-2'-O-)-methyltransferase RlmB, putative / transcript_product=23S rRNA (guanosine-2'-O-)-methyltransferase RlmB, putative / location=Cvel_scaffold25:108308-112429(+) / protein_length=563 / sequence_SO=supercontig / SO=protein_coding / is_pseudo=false